MSLKESGKSRADLWQLAANTAINIAIDDANQACDDPGQIAETFTLEYFLIVLTAGFKCHIQGTNSSKW